MLFYKLDLKKILSGQKEDLLRETTGISLNTGEFTQETKEDLHKSPTKKRIRKNQITPLIDKNYNTSLNQTSLNNQT